MVSRNVSASGMEKHIAGYFLAGLLRYYPRTKMYEGHRAPPLNPLRDGPLGAPRLNRLRIKRDKKFTPVPSAGATPEE